MSRRRKRPPGSSQRSTGASRQRVSDRFPGSDALVESMLSGFAPHLEENGPLGSELLLSNLFGMIWSRSEYGRTEAVEAFTDEIIESQPFSHEAGGLLLLTIAKIGPSSLREKAQQLFDYGLSSGRGQWQLPGWLEKPDRDCSSREKRNVDGCLRRSDFLLPRIQLSQNQA